jgi:hypothetical protein
MQPAFFENRAFDQAANLPRSPSAPGAIDQPSDLDGPTPKPAPPHPASPSLVAPPDTVSLGEIPGAPIVPEVPQSVDSNWSEPDSLMLSLDEDSAIAVDVVYEFSADGVLLSAALATTADELTSMFHLAFANGSPDVTVEVDLVNTRAPLGQQTRLWEVRLSSPLWGSVDLSTDILYRAGQLEVDEDGRGEYYMEVERVDWSAVDGSLYGSSYDYSGTQLGTLSEDAARMIWTQRTGSVSALHEPPCAPEPCPELIDLTQNSVFGEWNRL